MVCTPKSPILCTNLHCVICYEKSFASLDLNIKGIYYSPENELTERQILKTKAMDIKFKMICNNELCGHTNIMFGKHILAGHKCSYCCNPPKSLCTNLNCLPCFNKSFASQPDIDLWSDKNLKLPRMCFKASRQEILFSCVDCGHDYKKKLYHFTSQVQRCPYCKGKRCNSKNCDICDKKKFSSHPKSEYLIDKDKAKDLALYSHIIMKFQCDKNKEHIFSYSCFNIVYGHWCPSCKNKTEHLVKNKLSESYDIEHQAKFNWCKNNNNNFLPFDFVIKNKKIIIEIDGEQHFKQISNWKSPEITRQTDLEKMKHANLNGYQIIRIFQLDIFNNTYDWLRSIFYAIIILEKYDTIKRIYIASNLWYDIYTNINEKINIEFDENKNYNTILDKYIKTIKNNDCELYIKHI